MTTEDIKEALEACTDINIPCGSCPYNGVKNCYDTLKNDARELIIAQESEIDRLKANDEEACLKCIESKHATAEEYAELQEEFANYQLASDKEIRAQVKQAKIDVLNELKDKMFEREYMGVKYKERIFYESEIDDMIAEVQNAENKG